MIEAMIPSRIMDPPPPRAVSADNPSSRSAPVATSAASSAATAVAPTVRMTEGSNSRPFGGRSDRRSNR